MKLNDFVGFYNNIKCHVIILWFFVKFGGNLFFYFNGLLLS